ncbi:hypothetical protein [Enterovibrio nigricans]|uniref:hypothetical protein n=1 Tax=Enterovibrio nigricans TaxID=504469 RepID=UPI001116F435|nr:hypothetical protein [Enterovibrio nigricans]
MTRSTSIEFTPPQISEILEDGSLHSALHERGFTIDNLNLLYDDSKKIGSVLNIICDALPNPKLHHCTIKRHENDEHPMTIGELANMRMVDRYGFDLTVYQFILQVRGLRSPQESTGGGAMDMSAMYLDDDIGMNSFGEMSMFTL